MDAFCVLCFQQTREEMKSLQEAFQKQLNEAAEKAEKQQATVSDSLALFHYFVYFFCPFFPSVSIPSALKICH